MSKLIEYFAENMDSDEWSRLQGAISAQGVAGVVRSVSNAIDEVEDEEDPAGAADRKVARDRRKLSRDARRRVIRDAVRRAKDANPLDPEDPNRPEAMDEPASFPGMPMTGGKLGGDTRRRSTTAEDRALFELLYPGVELPAFVGEVVRRPRGAKPVKSAIAIKDIYPDATPVRHIPGTSTKMII